jgi:hypothetical protein
VSRFVLGEAIQTTQIFGLACLALGAYLVMHTAN